MSASESGGQVKRAGVAMITKEQYDRLMERLDEDIRLIEEEIEGIKENAFWTKVNFGVQVITYGILLWIILRSRQ